MSEVRIGSCDQLLAATNQLALSQLQPQAMSSVIRASVCCVISWY